LSQNTNHGSTTLSCYAAEVYQKGLIRYKYFNLEIKWAKPEAFPQREREKKINQRVIVKEIY